MKLLPDTNVLVYDTVEDSERHMDASKILDDAEELFLAPIVLHEFVWVLLKFSVDPDTVSVKVEEYLGDPRANYIQESVGTIEGALKLLKDSRLPASDINDLIVLTLAVDYKLTIATFDAKLASLAKRKGVSIIPESFSYNLPTM